VSYAEYPQDQATEKRQVHLDPNSTSDSVIEYFFKNYELQDEPLSRFKESLAYLGPTFSRDYHTRTLEHLQNQVDEIRSTSSAVLGLAPRRSLSPQFDYMSPYAVIQALGRFRFVHEVDTGSQLPPLIFASDTHYLHASKIVRYQKPTVSPKSALQKFDNPVRTWIGNEGYIHKSEIVSIDYLERSQVAHEAMFLKWADINDLPAELFPRVKHSSFGRAVVELVRDSVSGIPINSSEREHIALIRSFHAACHQYSALGLFHNDLRPWNLLLDDDTVRFIDFSDVSASDCDPTGLPQIGAYIGTILVLSGLLDLNPQNFPAVISQLLPKAPRGKSWADLWRTLPPSLPLSVVHKGLSIDTLVNSLLAFVTRINK
jgi:hypothetical protein